MARAQLRPEEVRQLAEGWGVDPRFALAIFGQESSSGKNPTTSSKGARGGFQVLPATFQRFNPNGNIDDPVDNANAALAYMRELLTKYPDPEEAAQAYFGGAPVRVRGRDYADPSGTTMSQYGRSVVARMGRTPPDALEGTYLPARGYDAQADFDTTLGGSSQPSPYTPGLLQLADAAPSTPSLSDFASMPLPMGRAPQGNPMAAMMAKMYGAVDPETGVPMDIVSGLRDAGTEAMRSHEHDQYLQNLVNTTLKGMDFG